MSESKIPPQSAHRPILYVVATVHLDTQWRWTIQDTIREFIPATLQRNFELLGRFPFFVVSFEGAFRYQLMKEYYPQQFAHLRRWVEEGRWRVAGSMLDSPDVNVVAPESLLRHILYGNQFFQRELSVQSCDLFLPDCFGFGWALPSIAAHCGLAGFSAQKFGKWMAPAKIPFDVGVWQGPDGGEVVAALRPEGYGEGLDEDLSIAERFASRLERTRADCGAAVGLKYVGVGDRGGGLDEESMRWLERSVESRGETRVIVSGSDQLFRDLSPRHIERMSRHRDELLLPTHGTGCFTAQARLKRWNRRCEQLADAAERAAATAAWLGLIPYPAERLRSAWSRFLWHQMHDDLTGTSIPSAYLFTRNDQLLALESFATVLNRSIGAIASRLDTSPEGYPIVVFNPLAIERREIVEVEIHPDLDASRLRIVGPDGKEVPSQRIGGSDQNSLLFLADLPPCGLAVYTGTAEEARGVFDLGLHVTRSSLDNARYRVEIDADGNIGRIYDKLLKQELFETPAVLELLPDRSRRWPAWEVLYEDLQARGRPITGPAEVEIVEQGPLRVALRVVRRFHRSIFEQVLRLTAGDTEARLDVHHAIDWQARARMLKARFSFPWQNPRARFDLGLGVIERDNSRRERYEVPAQQWADLTAADQSIGVSILSDCKYGWDKPDDRTLRLSLLRSPGVRRRFRHQGAQDRGHHRFTVSLFAHGPTWSPAETSWQAARLHQPPLAYRTRRRHGELGNRFSFLRADSDAVMVQSLKHAEEPDRWIVRLRELSGERPVTTRIRFASSARSAVEVDGMERTLSSGGATEDGSLRTTLSPFGIQSFAVDLEPPTRATHQPRSLSLPLAYDHRATTFQNQVSAEGFDGRGGSIPAELFPRHLEFCGVEFRLGSPEVANAMRCRGQRLDLPATDLDRLHLILTAAPQAVDTRFGIGDESVMVTIPSYSGFLTGEPLPGRRWPWSRIRPSVRLQSPALPVIWMATHRHDRSGRDEPYVFCYLFELVLPTGVARRVRLPEAPTLHLFAATLTDQRWTETQPATTLYD